MHVTCHNLPSGSVSRCASSCPKSVKRAKVVSILDHAIDPAFLAKSKMSLMHVCRGRAVVRRPDRYAKRSDVVLECKV